MQTRMTGLSHPPSDRSAAAGGGPPCDATRTGCYRQVPYISLPLSRHPRFYRLRSRGTTRVGTALLTALLPLPKLQVCS